MPTNRPVTLNYRFPGAVATRRVPSLAWDAVSLASAAVSTVVVFAPYWMYADDQPDARFAASHDAGLLVLRSSCFVCAVSVSSWLRYTRRSHMFFLAVSLMAALFQFGYLAVGALRFWADATGGWINPG